MVMHGGLPSLLIIGLRASFADRSRMSLLNSVALRNQTTLIVSAIVMGLLAPGKAVL